MPIEVRDGGTDKTVQALWAREGGTDKEVQEVVVNDSGTDKIAFTMMKSEIQNIGQTTALPSHNSNSVTSMMDFGAGFDGRECWVVVPYFTDNLASINDLKIGGNSAALVEGFISFSGNFKWAVVYWKYRDDGNLGTTANVEVVFSNNVIHTGMIPFSADPSSLLDTYAAYSLSSTPSSGSINTSSQGWSFYCSFEANTVSGGTLNNSFIQGPEFDMGSNEWVYWGYNLSENNGTATVADPIKSQTSPEGEIITAIST